MAETSTVVLTDAAMMRAMAHPLRMRILGSLRVDGPATSAILARRLRTDSGQTSHHLRLLARHGFVVEKAVRGRERWWKAAHESTRWSSESGGSEAEMAVERAARAAYDSAIDQFHLEAAHRTWSPEWQRAAVSGDQVIRCTPDRLRRLSEQIEALVREADLGDAGAPGAETVVVVLHAYPRRRQS